MHVALPPLTNYLTHNSRVHVCYCFPVAPPSPAASGGGMQQQGGSKALCGALRRHGQAG